jgi:pyrimidine deaminase RibD-like protein
MRISDFQIHDQEKLDDILVGLCAMTVAELKHDPTQVARVAAAVLDNKNRLVTGIAYESNGKYVHGERDAIHNYKKMYGAIPAGSIIITTCSPCTEPMPDRVGSSCQDLISGTDVHKVYAGYRDPSQQTWGSDKTYHLQITRNKKIQELCKAFADTWIKDELNEVATVDVDAIHAEALREHLLSTPALYEDRDDFQKMRHFLNTHKTPEPVVNHSYVYASVQATPISKYVSTAHFNEPYQLVKIDDNYAYFNINGNIKRFPETGTLSGDSLSEIYFFKSAQQLDHFNTLLKLKFSDYKSGSKILNQDQLDELSFLGSPCTKDCSGHRAGYAWSQAKGGRVAQSPFSPSFNTGSQLHVDGK